MRKLLIATIIILSSISAYAQSTPAAPIQNISTDSGVTFRLFATKNLYTFIKLDTRNGKMWQVQWSTGDDILQVPLSLTPLVSKNEEKVGRFFLYPTINTYNFILLDQVDGRVWQVQWNTEEKSRLVVPIY